MRRIALAAALAAVVGVAVAGTAAAIELTPEERTGRQIFFEGRGDGAEVFAYFGRENVRMPAVLMPCANCHGHDGLGRPEGGVTPPNITWRNLTKSYGHRHENGREHGPFDEQSVAGAIMGGVDPDGNSLDPLMPRYEFSDEDVTALVAFLKKLESSRDPGLSEDAIRIGTLLPDEGPYGGLGQAVAGALRAYFDELNETGGVFGRRLELVVADYAGGDPEATAENARRLIEEDGGVFAVVSDFTLGAEEKVFAVFEEAGVPQIDPFTLFAGHAGLPSERTFFLLSGLPDQARALVAYTADHVDPRPKATALVIPPTGLYEGLVRVVEDQARRSGMPAPAVVRLSGDRRAAAQAVTELRQAGVEAIYFFGDTQVLAGVAEAAVRRGWVPRLLLPGQTAGPAVFSLPPAYDGRVHLTYPNLPEDQSVEGREEFRALQARHELAGGHVASQVRAVAAAKVLVEALRRSGRSLSRTSLVAELEGMGKFDTGQLPALSFASNRRVGARGAHVLTIDLAGRRFRPEAAWVSVD